jgi:hypothetical protein
MHRKLKTGLILLGLVYSCMAASRNVIGVLYPFSSVYLNGNELGELSTVTAGDVIRTKDHGMASLHSSRSVTSIPPDSVVRIENGSLALDGGTISMNAGEGIASVIPETLKTSFWTKHCGSTSGTSMSVRHPPA